MSNFLPNKFNLIIGRRDYIMKKFLRKWSSLVMSTQFKVILLLVTMGLVIIHNIILISLVIMVGVIGIVGVLLDLYFYLKE